MYKTNNTSAGHRCAVSTTQNKNLFNYPGFWAQHMKTVSSAKKVSRCGFMKGKLTIRRYLQVTDNLAETTRLKKATVPKSHGFICSLHSPARWCAGCGNTKYEWKLHGM